MAEGIPGRDVWKDNKEDLIFSHTDMVLNMHRDIPTDQITPWIDRCLAMQPNKGIFSMIIHEEYFYPDYRIYIPDCGERVLKAIQHVYDKGFRGASELDVEPTILHFGTAIQNSQCVLAHEFV